MRRLATITASLLLPVMLPGVVVATPSDDSDADGARSTPPWGFGFNVRVGAVALAAPSCDDAPCQAQSFGVAAAGSFPTLPLAIEVSADELQFASSSGVDGLALNPNNSFTVDTDATHLGMRMRWMPSLRSTKPYVALGGSLMIFHLDWTLLSGPEGNASVEHTILTGTIGADLGVRVYLAPHLVADLGVLVGFAPSWPATRSSPAFLGTPETASGWILAPTISVGFVTSAYR